MWSSRTPSGSPARPPSRSSGRPSRPPRPPRTRAAGGLHGRRRARCHRQPEAEPECTQRERDRLDDRVGRPARHPPSAPMLSARPTSVTRRSDRTRTTNPETSAPSAVAPASAPERDPLLVRAAVEHPIDEHRAADDRGREAVPREQRDERGRAEGARAGTGAGRGTGRSTRRPRTTVRTVPTTASEQDAGVTRRVEARAAMLAIRQGQADEAGGQRAGRTGRPERRPPGPRGAASPSRRRRPRRGSARRMPIGTLM